MVPLTKTFLAEVDAISRVRGAPDAPGDAVDGLVLVSAGRSDCSEAAWVCHEDEAPSVGALVRVTVEVVA